MLPPVASPLAASPVAPSLPHTTRQGVARLCISNIQIHAAREILLITMLFIAYKCGRLAAIGHVKQAFTNANAVWNIERTLRLPDESVVQRLLLTNDVVVRIANMYYAYVHFPATAIFLIWLYRHRQTYYLFIRRTLVGLTAVGLGGHLLFPLAPPRMLHECGLIDTARQFGPTVYGSPDTDQLSNQYAAMPSLHVGWALVVAMGLIVATRSRWRWLWLLHPLVTLLVVVGTANHYWLDAIIATVILGAVLIVLAAAAPGPRAITPHAPTI